MSTSLIQGSPPHKTSSERVPVDPQLYDRWSKKRYRTWRRRLTSLLWWPFVRFLRLHGYLIAIRTLHVRSEFESKLLRNSRLLDLGPDGEMAANGRIVKCKRTHARIADIENFYAKWPGATWVDSWAYLQGWEAGERFALRSARTPEMPEKLQP